MMLVVVLYFIVRVHSFSRNQSPTTPAPLGTVGKALTFPPGPLGKPPAPSVPVGQAPPPAPGPVGKVPPPAPGPVGKAPAPPPGPVGKAPNLANVEGPVDANDKLDDISRLVLGYTIEELQSMATTDRDHVLTGYNIVQEQYMRIADWIKSELDRIDYYSWQAHVRSFHEMVLQWLEDVVQREKSRKRVKKEMIREWKKMEEQAKPRMIERFIGFRLLDEMANAT